MTSDTCALCGFPLSISNININSNTELCSRCKTLSHFQKTELRLLNELALINTKILKHLQTGGSDSTP